MRMCVPLCFAGQTIDADEAQFTHLAEPAVTALEQELMGEARMPWSVADEVVSDAVHVCNE